MYLVGAGWSFYERARSSIEFNYGEAIVLDQVRRVASGQALYTDPTTLPLTVTAYPPIYYLVVASLQSLSGDASYAAGRSTSIAATVLSAALLVWAVRYVSGQWTAGLLAAGLFVTQNLTVLFWAPSHRVDSLAVCFTLAGLALATSKRSTLAAVPLAAAVLTKQSYLAAPLSLLIVLWPDRPRLLPFVGLFAGCLALGIGVTAWLTNGLIFWHTVFANANPLDFDYFATIFGAFLQFNALPVVAAAMLLALPARPAERLWRTYFGISGLVVVVTVGKLGASSNYWLEFTAATCALIGVLAARVADPVETRRVTTSTALASLVLASLLTCVPAYAGTVSQAVSLHFAGQDSQAAGEIVAVVAHEPGRVLTDDPAVAVLAGKRVEFEFIIFTILAAQHVWDESPILNAIAAHQFGLVVLTESLDVPPRSLLSARISDRVRAALQVAYASEGLQAGYWLYRPRSET
jgi:hypothetical protein